MGHSSQQDKTNTTSHIHLQQFREGLKIQPQRECGSFVCFAKALYMLTICMHNEHAISPAYINIWRSPKHVLNGQMIKSPQGKQIKVRK